MLLLVRENYSYSPCSRKKNQPNSTKSTGKLRRELHDRIEMRILNFNIADTPDTSNYAIDLKENNW